MVALNKEKMMTNVKELEKKFDTEREEAIAKADKLYNLLDAIEEAMSAVGSINGHIEVFKIDTDKLDSSAAKNLEKFYKKISKELEDHIEEYSWINFF